MTTIKLNDTAAVIVSKANGNANIIPSFETSGVSSQRAYTMAVRSFIKNEWVKEIGGLKGTAQPTDYATEEGRRLFLTQAFLDAFYGSDDTVEATNVAAKFAKPAKTPKKAKKEAIPSVEDIQDEADDQALIDAMLSEEEGVEEEDQRNSKVAQTYKKAYAELKAQGGSGQGCNDVIDKWMTAQFMRKTIVVKTVTNKKGGQREVKRNVVRLDREGIVAFASENNILDAKYLTLNNGMLRMDIANKVRSLLAAGKPIKHKGKVALRATRTEKEAA